MMTANEMNEWGRRMYDEFHQTHERYCNLRRMLIKADAGTLDFKPKCPIGLLRDQLDIMRRYLEVLAIRAEIEGVDLDAARTNATG